MQLRDFDDEEEDEVRLPIPVTTLALIGPKSEAPPPARESSRITKRDPAVRAFRRTPLRPLLVGVLVCMAVLCALLVASVALPSVEPPSDESRSSKSSHERDRLLTDDPGKASNGRRK
jgi:hypothetical protein